MAESEVAAKLGLSRRRPVELVHEGVLVRLRRGVVVGSCLVERATTDPRFAHLLQVQALLLAFEDCAASHESAAVALGLPVLDLPPYVVGTRPQGAWRSAPEFRVRIAPLPDDHLACVDAVRSTSHSRTVVDIARTSSLQAAFVVGDAALRSGTSRSELSRVLEDCAGWADVGKARRALPLLDGRSESALESVSRGVFVENDFPMPELQVVIQIDPITTFRLDFFWEEYGVAGEADGLQKYIEPEVLRAEKLRQELVERFGIKVVRWNYREIRFETTATLARISDTFTR
jgi:very-short-patch-repair endonuclease